MSLFYGGSETLLDRAFPKQAYWPTWIFFAAIAIVVLFSTFTDLRPAFEVKGTLKPLSMNLVIQMMMLIAGATMLIVCKVKTNEIANDAVFKAGMVAIFSVFGVAWMSDTFFHSHLGELLDAQYFGVAQQRRSVFVVASARTNFCPATVLFEPDSVRRHPEPRTTAGKTVTPHAVIGSHWDSELNPHPTLNQSHNTGGIGMSNQEIFSQRGSGLVSTYRLLSFGEYRTDDISSTLRSRDDKSATDLITIHNAVRRLTPVECERLQGFPDNHTRIPWNGKTAADYPDGHRYRAIGNSMAVPVMAWIGKRILMQMRQQ